MVTLLYGTYDVEDATMADAPQRRIEFAGQQWTQSFEATALVLDGPMANAYLGSVEWGWQVDASGICGAKSQCS